MKIKMVIAVLTLFGVLVSCAERGPHPMDMSVAVKSAKTAADHQALADHYEQVARNMEREAEAHRQILAQFRKDPHDYPKEYKGGNFEVHCERLIDIYERAAQANRQMAEEHRRMAGGTQ